MTFHCNARYFLLTYAQSGDLDGWAVNDHLGTLGAECIVARENHADGGTHLHCFVDFGRKFRSRKANVFDVAGCHANIVPSRGSAWAGFDYACKDGDIIAGGLGRPRQPGCKPTDNDVRQYAEITNAVDPEHFWELLHDLDPRAAVLHFSAIQKYVSWQYDEPEPEFEPRAISDFDPGFVDGRDEWLRQSRIGSPGSHLS